MGGEHCPFRLRLDQRNANAGIGKKNTGMRKRGNSKTTGFQNVGMEKLRRLDHRKQVASVMSPKKQALLFLGEKYTIY